MSDQWKQLSWIVPADITEILGAELGDIGALGIQEDYLPGEEPPPRQPWEEKTDAPSPKMRCLKIWFPNDAAVEDLVAELQKKYSSTGPCSWSHISEDDWEQDWKKHFHRFVISPSLAISPPWEAQEGDLVIEPGLAFGTGNHPTTLSCLEAIASWAKAGERCLDLGCGTGILALAASKLGMDAHGVDIEPEAVLASRQNAKLNKLEATFDDTPIENLSQIYPLVVANLYAEVLVTLAPHILPLVSRHLALAGILHDRVHLVKQSFSSLRLVREKQEGEWVSLWFAR